MAQEKVILFDGKDTAKWTKRYSPNEQAEWVVGDDGAMTVRGGDIVSTETYKDAHIHVEFWLPLMADCFGQARANSGVYVHGRYEIQVLDSFGVKDFTCSDCGGIYSIKAPDVNANIEPEKWQTYDIYFRAARFNENNEKIEDARLTVIFNGQCIHNNVVLPHNTPGGITDQEVSEGPLMLQDHGNPVRFRNVWFERL